MPRQTWDKKIFEQAGFKIISVFVEKNDFFENLPKGARDYQLLSQSN